MLTTQTGYFFSGLVNRLYRRINQMLECSPRSW